MIGDSYIEGCCTKNEDSIAGNFRKHGFKVLSFGKNGAGPLTEYAIIKEYLNKGKINYNHLIWFFFENDLQNLELELKSNFLQEYLINESFDQDLINKQPLIDKLIKEYLSEEILKEDKKYRSKTSEKEQISLDRNIKFDISNFIKLYNTRSSLQLMPNDKNIDTFKKILSNVKTLVNKNNSNIYFVYIPSVETFSHYQKYQFKKPIISIIKDLDIKIIDLTNAINSLDNPLSIWPFECCGHFNEKGNELVSEFIIDEIELK